MAEEEVAMEVEALQAMYGEDCKVLNLYPPHLEVEVKPRTADVSSQQFVEAAVEILAGSQYPDEPPIINIIRYKGIDEKRLQLLSASLQDKAHELASCLMLVALCEEAAEKVSIMNHPDGDCPLCLCPLVEEDEGNEQPVSVMKFMSCYHCFHSQCVIRWWKWLQAENAVDSKTSESVAEKGTCPVCRKIFTPEDIERITELVSCGSAEVVDSEMEVHDDEKVLESDLETSRRKKFETITQLQEECGGLIKPRSDGVLFSSTSFWDLTSDDSSVINDQGNASRETGTSGSSNSYNETADEQRGAGFSSQGHRSQNVGKEPDLSETKQKQGQRRRQRQTGRGKEPRHSADKPLSSAQKTKGSRKCDGKDSRSKASQWIRKESS